MNATEQLDVDMEAALNSAPLVVVSLLQTVCAALETVQDSPQYRGNAVRLGHAIAALQHAADMVEEAAEKAERGNK